MESIRESTNDGSVDHTESSTHQNIIDDTESQEESQIHNENLISRFYRKDFPEENDIVIVSFYIFPLKAMSVLILPSPFCGID
jgi:hypothetical protein